LDGVDQVLKKLLVGSSKNPPLSVVVPLEAAEILEDALLLHQWQQLVHIAKSDETLPNSHFFEPWQTQNLQQS
jgi:hypothetical protein